MKSIFTIAIVGAVMLSSCSVYREGQTPDDLYYSPSREVRSSNNAYVETQSDRQDGRRNNDYSNSRSGYSAYDDFATMDDRWLMMRVRNPYRWSMFDDYTYYNSFSPIGGFYNPHFGGMGWGGGGFGYSPGWSFGLGFGSYNPWGFGGFGGMGYGMFNNYYNWNSFYNPYYGGYHPGIIVINNYNGKTNPSGYTTQRNFDLNRYSNSTRLSAAPRYNNTNPNRSIRYNNSNNSTLDNSGRRYSNGNDYYRTPSRSSDRPVRTYNPSSRNYSPSSGNNSTYSPSSSGGSSGGGGSSSSGGGGGSRPSRR